MHAFEWFFDFWCVLSIFLFSVTYLSKTRIFFFFLFFVLGFKTSQRGINLIKRFEGFSARAYQDSVGIWTIGYGHTGNNVIRGLIITPAQAESLLRKDVHEAENDVKRQVKVQLTQNQFDALVSWTYNLGGKNLSQSTMLRLLNKGNYDSVPCQMMRWVYAGKKRLNGLVKRRKAEAQLFNNGRSFSCN